MMGAIITFGLFNLIYEKQMERERESREEQRREREKQEALETEKRNLIIQMGSKSNATALEAVEKLRAEGWLTDGSLRDAELYDANLDDADLIGADLREAKLIGASLKNAKLQNARLSKSYMTNADLSNANLYKADLREAYLNHVDFSGADLKASLLYLSQLRYTDFSSADLRGASLGEVLWADPFGGSKITAKFDNNTILPDARFSELREIEGYDPIDKYWDEDVDMSRYTNPSHPDFWEAWQAEDYIEDERDV